MSLKMKAAGALINQIRKSESVNKLVENVKEKIDERPKKKSKAEECLEKISKPYYLIVKTKSISIGSIASLAGAVIGSAVGKTSFDKEIQKIPIDSGAHFLVYDEKKELLYYADCKSGDIIDREKVYLKDDEHNKVGYIKEWLMAVGDPFFERDVKKCTITLFDEKLCVLKKYHSTGSDEARYSVLDSNIAIAYRKDMISLKRGGKEIGIIHIIPFGLKDGYVDRYIIEYDDIQEEEICLLIALGFDIIATA